MWSILALGATKYGLDAVFDTVGVSPSVNGLGQWQVPVLTDVPILGPAVFRSNGPVLLLIVLTVLSRFVLKRARFGRCIEASGEAPTARRGLIARAANIFGGWTALGAVAASLLFGAAQALEVALQIDGVDVPPQLLLVIP